MNFFSPHNRNEMLSLGGYSIIELSTSLQKLTTGGGGVKGHLLIMDYGEENWSLANSWGWGGSSRQKMTRLNGLGAKNELRCHP